MSNSPSYQLPELYPSCTNQTLERTDHVQDGTCQQHHTMKLERAPFPNFHNSSSKFSNGPQSVSSAPSSCWSLNENPKFAAPNVQGQLPFTPECPLEVEVFQQWRAGNPAYQHPSTSSEIPSFAGWNCGSPTAADGTINMTDSGVDFSEPPQQPETDNECPSPSVTQEVCKNPGQCELSPDMAQAMERFSVPHICEYEQAKTLLVKKIVDKVLQNAAPRIMALLEEELQKREAEMDDEEEDDDMDSDF